MAVFTAVKLYTGQPNTTATTLYTAPASTRTIVKNIMLCNTTSTDTNITMSLVPSGGTAGTANRILAGLVVKANDTVVIEISGILNTGDFISALQATNGAITAHITGIEVV